MVYVASGTTEWLLKEFIMGQSSGMVVWSCCNISIKSDFYRVAIDRCNVLPSNASPVMKFIEIDSEDNLFLQSL